MKLLKRKVDSSHKINNHLLSVIGIGNLVHCQEYHPAGADVAVCSTFFRMQKQNIRKKIG